VLHAAQAAYAVSAGLYLRMNNGTAVYNFNLLAILLGHLGPTCTALLVIVISNISNCYRVLSGLGPRLRLYIATLSAVDRSNAHSLFLYVLNLQAFLQARVHKHPLSYLQTAYTYRERSNILYFQTIQIKQTMQSLCGSTRLHSLKTTHKPGCAGHLLPRSCKPAHGRRPVFKTNTAFEKVRYQRLVTIKGYACWAGCPAKAGSAAVPCQQQEGYFVQCHDDTSRHSGPHYRVFFTRTANMQYCIVHMYVQLVNKLASSCNTAAVEAAACSHTCFAASPRPSLLPALSFYCFSVIAAPGCDPARQWCRTVRHC
jgi:hypothetical protein